MVLIIRLFLVGSIAIVLNVNSSLAQNVQGLIGSYEKALNSNNTKNAQYLSNRIGFEYWRSGDLKKSIEYFTESLEHAEKLDDTNAMQSINASMGLVNAELGKHNDAIKYYQRSIKLDKAGANKNLLADTYINMAIAYQANGKLKRAVSALEGGLPVVLALNDSKLKETCYKLLTDYNEQLGNNEEANKYADSYKLLVESKQKASEVNAIENQLNRAETESDAAKTALLSQAEQLNKTKQTLREMERIAVERQLEVNLLNTEKELSAMTMKAQEADLKSSRIMIYSFIIGLILVSSLVVVIFIDNKKKKEAKRKIEEQHLNIKSSINYAQRIQGALLPQEGSAGEFVDNNTFIFFKPRDVVSGDFYWYKKLNDRGDIAIAAVDCTGHGIPGAFMSMIGLNALNNIVARGIHSVNRILDLLHMEIRSTLKQQETGNNDGMDMALCIIKPTEKTIEYAGAKNPLVYMQNGETIKIKADTHPIGGGKYSKDKRYTKHEIQIETDTMLYLFSDGFQDQFGGPDNMKFMTKKFRELLHDIHLLPLEKQKSRLDQTLEEWKGDIHQTDDILVIGVKISA